MKRGRYAPKVPKVITATPQEEEYSQIILGLMTHLAKCRMDIVPFFEFVMREEFTKKPVTIAKHQEIGLRFMMDHERCVNMWPVNHSKSFSSAAMVLFLLGQNRTTRGCIVSATEEQAKKPLLAVKDYIENSQELHLVFPDLKKSLRDSDPWTQTAITVDRPMGIRDASLKAVGINGAIDGSRLNWILVDDILNQENTNTKAQRDKVYDWFGNSVLSRLDPQGSKIIVTNTARHPDDLAHRLEKMGWPTMRMAIDGSIHIQDDQLNLGAKKPPWDHRLLVPVPSNIGEPETLRILGHQPGDSLWPERFPPDVIEKLRATHLPSEFNKLFMNICRDDGTAMCKVEWIELCKKNARDLGFTSLTSKFVGDCFTGVDLAVQKGEEHDDTAFFTFAVLPGGKRLILDVEIGQFDGPVIVDKVAQKHRQYNSIIRIENVAAQDYLLQFTREKYPGLPLKAHTTTAQGKAHPQFGVASLFIEFQNGDWLIPCDNLGRCSENVQKFIDACLYYSPNAHTPDILMAAFFAREQARHFGALSGTQQQASSIDSFLSR